MFTKADLQAIIQLIDIAWQNGAVRSPQGASQLELIRGQCTAILNGEVQQQPLIKEKDQATSDHEEKLKKQVLGV